MSSHGLSFLTCDGCRMQFRQPHGSANTIRVTQRIEGGGTAMEFEPVVMLPTAKQVRILARSRGWKCRAWTTDFRMIDACPKCIPSFNFGRRVDILGLTTKQK